MLKFISFGSGSSGNCYMLYTENDALLVDLGIGLRTLKKYIREYGLSLAKVSALLVTHDHADHVKSVGKMSSDLQIPVYTTRKVHVGIDNNYVVRTKITPQILPSFWAISSSLHSVCLTIAPIMLAIASSTMALFSAL